MRQAPFEININGPDHLVTTSDSVTLEGANASFQVHLRIDPKRFADTFNAAQLVTPLAVAIGANSPLFLGHRLWDETRLALFKQGQATVFECQRLRCSACGTGGRLSSPTSRLPSRRV